MILQPPKLSIVDAHLVPAIARRLEPMNGVTPAQCLGGGDEVARRITHGENDVQGRTETLGGSVQHYGLTRLGSECPHVNILTRKDAAIGRDWQRDRLRDRPAIHFVFRHLRQIADDKF